MRKPLPREWIERLFKRLSLEYGSRFTNMWSSNDPEDMIDFWAGELACFYDNKAAIQYGVEHLPETFPPTAAEFRRLCLGNSDRPKALLPEPLANPEVIAQAMESISTPTKSNPKAWAHRLREREESGEILHGCQKTMWRAALKLPAETNV
jgi:hypothetical protein